jgi:hypothetical protein
MQINPKIKEVLSEYNLDYRDSLAYLLSIYFDCKPSYTPPLLVQKLNVTNILGIVDQKLHWNVPLFIGTLQIEDKWEWITEWMQGFSNKNPERRGTKSTAITRMKTFFANNPDVRKDDIISATDLYLRNTDPRFIHKSHKFIYDGIGKNLNSTLEEWVDKVKEHKEAMGDLKDFPVNDVTFKMQ